MMYFTGSLRNYNLLHARHSYSGEILKRQFDEVADSCDNLTVYSSGSTDDEYDSYSVLLRDYEDKVSDFVSKSRYILYFITPIIAKRLGLMLMRFFLTKYIGRIVFQ